MENTRQEVPEALRVLKECQDVEKRLVRCLAEAVLGAIEEDPSRDVMLSNLANVRKAMNRVEAVLPDVEDVVADMRDILAIRWFDERWVAFDRKGYDLDFDLLVDTYEAGGFQAVEPIIREEYAEWEKSWRLTEEIYELVPRDKVRNLVLEIAEDVRNGTI